MKKDEYFKILLFVVAQLIILVVLTLPLIIFAANGGGQGNPPVINIKFPNPFKGGDTLQKFIEVVINDVILPIGSVVVAIMIIYAGFMFVTARGNEAKLETARRNFLYVVIGTAVLLGAWVIAKAIGATINQITTP
jgi:hypothetical protein